MRGRTLCSPHFFLPFILLSPFFLPHPQLAQLTCRFSAFLVCIWFSSSSPPWISYLILSFILTSTFTVFCAALTLGSSPWLCHCNLPVTSFCFQPLQVTIATGHMHGLCGVTWPCRIASDTLTSKSGPAVCWSIMTAAWVPLRPCVFAERNGTTELVPLQVK